MSIAFQSGAFQSSAFQASTSKSFLAFQSGAFQSSAFQASTSKSFLAFQSGAFQSYAYQTFTGTINPPVKDTHDGGLPKRKLHVPQYEKTEKKKKPKPQIISDLRELVQIIDVQALPEREIVIIAPPVNTELLDSIQASLLKLKKIKAQYDQDDMDLLMIAALATLH